MALVFNGYELGALLFAVLIANFLTQDGESNWFEGVQLIASTPSSGSSSSTPEVPVRTRASSWRCDRSDRSRRFSSASGSRLSAISEAMIPTANSRR